MQNSRFSSPDWKPLYEAAVLETDVSKLPDRIAKARSAILDRVEESLARPLLAEQAAMNDALRNLGNLARTAAARRAA